MQSATRPLIVTLAAVAVLCGCAAGTATRPEKTAASKAVPVDCTDLSAQLASAQQRKSAAAAGQRDAWKVVIPFAVAARYAGAIASANDADKDIARLQAELQRAGCTG